ncbi:MAG: hypothetical protein GF400_08085 [Candidatus Eisenbacteria bacterium]|nr:hypothetical protein [Candidatus Eisenbacteria bacterium]
MGEIARSVQNAFERTEVVLGRSWPVWALALLFYAFAAYILLTRVRLPSPAHLVVYTMAAAILVITLMKVEWALLGLVLMIPFARPGFTIGELKIFHVSAFNMAMIGVWLVFIVRHFADRELAAKGPLFRRTPLDVAAAVFLLLLILTSLINLNYNLRATVQARTLLYMKEYILYFAWFYLVVTLLRTPSDLRRFALFFAGSAILVATFGLWSRVTGASQSAQVMSEAERVGGVAGGRTGGVGEGGWFGLGHPNLFAAFLIMAMPFWYYATAHLRKLSHRMIGNMAIVFGFVALLYTYSRAAWGGITIGLGVLGLRDPSALRRTLIFVVAFVIVAQVMTVSLIGMGVVEVIQMRFEQLGRSNFSARPEIYAAAMDLLRERPFRGVGLFAFSEHASVTFTSRVAHAHNVFLTMATEAGIPGALAFTVFIGWIFFYAVRSLRVSKIPGYGFLAQSSFVGLFAILTLMQFDHIFFDRNVGHAFFALLAIIVAQNRMIQERLLPGMEHEITQAPGPLWIES